jgi:DNA-binding NarL/FixJ family response regulator
LQTHILLLDVCGPVDFGAIYEVRKRCPGTRIVVWTHGISLEVAHQVRAAGVRGILRKDSSKDQVLRCLIQVAAGEPWFERSLLNSLLEVRRVRLSPRERQLMRLVAQGFSNKQLAAELMISEGTVKVYLAKLFRKIGVHDRYELAMFGLRSMGVTAVDIIAAASNYPLFADSIVFEQPRPATADHVSHAEPARALRQTA